MRRAAWRARSAGFAAATWSRCPGWRRLAELNELFAAGDVGRRRPPHRPAAPTPWARPRRPRWRGCGRCPTRRSTRPTVLASVRVDTKGRICVRQSFYSVPGGPGPAQRRRSASAPRRFEVVADGKVVARHDRACTRAPRTWCWTTTWRSWSASRAPCPARPPWPRPGRAGRSAPPTSGSGPQARRQLGDGAGTRALIGVLLLHRRHARRSVVIAAMAAALAIGSVDPEVVAIEARRIAARPPARPRWCPSAPAPATSGPPRRLAGYDDLAGRRRVDDAPWR